MRLIHVLYNRLEEAKERTEATNDYAWKPTLITAAAVAERNASDKYGHYLPALFSLLVKRMDVAKYEDSCRDLFGADAHLMFQMDKLVIRLCQQVSQASKVMWCTKNV